MNITGVRTLASPGTVLGAAISVCVLATPPEGSVPSGGLVPGDALTHRHVSASRPGRPRLQSAEPPSDWTSARRCRANVPGVGLGRVRAVRLGVRLGRARRTWLRSVDLAAQTKTVRLLA
jgi:hypothetical protein